MQKSTSSPLKQLSKVPNALIYISIWGSFLGLALALFDLSVTSLFLYHHGLKDIPEVFFMAGFLGFFLAMTISFLQNYVAIGRLAGGFFIFLGLIGIYTLLSTSGQETDSETFKGVLFWSFVALYPINALSLFLFEGVYNRLFDLRIAKRYNNRASIGLMLAASIGLFLIPVLLPNIDTKTADILPFLKGVYSASIWLMIASSICLVVMGFSFMRLRHIPIDLKEVQAKNGFFQLVEQPYVVSLALFLGLAVMLSICIDYFFWYIIIEQYDISISSDKRNLANLSYLVSFLGMFMGLGLLGALVVKIIFLSNLIKNYGLRMGLLVLPIGTGIFILLAWSASLIQWFDNVELVQNGTILTFLFIFLCLTKLIKDISSSAFKMPIFRRYLLPLDINLRADIQARLEGDVRHIAIWAMGILLMAYHTLFTQISGVIVISIGIIIALVLVVIRLHKEYRDILEETLNAQPDQDSSEDKYTEPKSLARQIVQDIHQVSSNQLPVYLNILNILNPVLYRQAVLDLLDDKDNNIQRFIAEFTGIVKSKLREYSAQDLESLMGENPPSADTFTVRLSLEEEVRHLISLLDTQILANREAEHLRTQGQSMKEALNLILKNWQSELRHLPLNLEEDTQKIVLHQAAKLCILEAIPVLDVILKSRYFPILEHAKLIQQTYSRLRGAEFRLERIKYIRQLTLSKQTEERVFGALLTIYASQTAQEELLPNLLQDPSHLVRYQALVASSSAKEVGLYYKLIERLDEPQYGNAAFAALVAIGEDIFPQLENAFYMTGQSQMIQLRIVQIYGRLGTEKAVALLLNKLNDANQNISHLALDMLSRCGRKMSEENAALINAELRIVCENLVWNLAIFITLEKYGLGILLKEALEAEIDGNYDEIFSLMALLYEPASISLVRTSLLNGEAERAEFAQELLNIVLSDTVKPVLIPLLDISSSYQEKIQNLQGEYPMEAVTQLNHPEALINIIQRDYKSTNRWTKACALDELAALEKFHNPSIFVANMVNPNTLISEIAYQFLYEQDPAAFKENHDFLYYKENYPSVVNLAHTMQYLEDPTASREARTRFDMVKFLRGVRNFKGVPGLILSEIAELIEWKHLAKGEQIVHYPLIEEMDYVLVYQGQVNLSSEGIILQIYKNKDFIHDLFYINEVISNVTLNAEEDSIIFKINRAKFHALISVNDQIPMAMLRYTNLQYDLVNSLHKDKLLPVADTLALNSIMQISKGYEAQPGEVLATYPFIEQMDVWLIQEGVVQLKSAQKTVRIQATSTLSQSQFGNDALSNLELKALTEARLFKFSEEQLEQINQDLNEVQFFRKVDGIQNLAGFTLLEIALKAELKTFTEGEKLVSYTDTQQMDAWLIFNGSLKVQITQKDGSQEEINISERVLIYPWYFLDKDIAHLSIEASNDSKVYLIQKDDFKELLNRFDQLSLGLLKLKYSDTYYPITNFLRNTPQLKALSVIDLLALAKAIQVKYYLAGDRIALYSKAEECDFFIIYSGNVRIQRGKKQTIEKNEKALIYASMLPEDMPDQIRLIAQTSTTVYLIRKSSFLPFLAHPIWREILQLEPTKVEENPEVIIEI